MTSAQNEQNEQNEQNTYSIPYFASPENLGLKDKSIPIFNDVFEYLSKQDNLSAKILTTHEKQPNLLKRYSLGELEENLLQFKSKNYEDFPQYLLIINKIIDLGNALNFWNLCSIIISLKIKSDKNPFGDDNFSTMKNTLDQLNKSANKVFISSRVKPDKIKLHQLSIPEKIGQLLFYASTRGGLLNTKSLLALLKSLPPPLIIYLDRITYPINLYDRYGNMEQKIRWEPDETSTILISSFISNFSVEDKEEIALVTKENIFSYIDMFLKKSLELDPDYQNKKKKINIVYPKNITDFLKIISTEFHLRIVPFLAHFAKGKFTSHPFDDNVFYRDILDDILTKQILVNNAFEDEDFIDKDFADDDFYSEIDIANMLFQNGLIKEIKNAITKNRSKTITAITEIKDAVESDLENKKSMHKPINLFLIEWFINYIKNATYIGQKIPLNKIHHSFSSYRRYLSIMNTHLFLQLTNSKIIHF